MAISAKTMRARLTALMPLVQGRSLKTIRLGQEKIGELMELKHRNQVLLRGHDFEYFQGMWVIPKDERREGVILYIHGGGYTCGEINYAIGFGSVLAQRYGVRVFCPAYRLAPEHPFPAALEDVLEAYRYLLAKGYSHITLCGESAGGGLCYALCLKLKELSLPNPCGIIAISPWTDLTASGESYEKNQHNDPAMTRQLLEFYADSYTDNRTDPLVSPLFADLSGMPPSLIFVGEDEIMLDDAVEMHKKLVRAGCDSQLVTAPERWHGYLMYGLLEDEKDFSQIEKFLSGYMTKQRKLRWMRLDNAAKIYPAARRQNWSNLFRVSATLSEAVDKTVLEQALDVTLRRFPSISVRLRRGVFWYYLQQLDKAPDICEESSYPLTPMTKGEVRRCAFRVLLYGNRIALEVFHSLTDGTGAMIVLKSLVAEYISQKYGVHIPATDGVLGRLEEPAPEELEDSFLKYSGSVAADRKENDAWHITGTPETEGFIHLTCFSLSAKDALAKAHSYGVTLTAFLCAALMQALQQMQKEQVPDIKKRKPIKVLLPVNLRSLFPSKTMRNFALYTSPEILTRLGQYSFEEICKTVSHHMGLEITPKKMSMRIATNVNSEKMLIVRVMPLFIKNLVMKLIYNAVGERKTCLSMSNLGNIKLPQEMKPYVKRMDFILGIQSFLPHTCGVLSYNDTLYINFIRNIKESELESHFYQVLQQLGLTVTVESNQRGDA